MSEYISLPNFIIFGGHKCASTSLAQLLAQHPDIYISRSKEPNYFCYDEGEVRENGKENTLESYQHFFQKNSQKVQNQKARGEASISYIANPKAPYRIKNLIPDVKLIAILRNPIERCYSDYMFDLRRGELNYNDTTFAQVISQNPGYINRGMYGKHLKTYWQIFSPEQIKIILFDDFVKNRDQVMKDLFNFLDVDCNFATTPIPKEATSGVPKNKIIYNFIYQPNPIKNIITSIFKPFIPKKVRVNLWKKAVNQSLKKPGMSLEDRQKLIEIYTEDILQLQDLLNRDLSHWRKLPVT